MKFFPIYSLGINPCLLPPRSFGIIGLGGKSRKIFEFKGVIWKIFRNKDLGVSNGTDSMLVSPFIAPTPVPRFTPLSLKARQNEGRSRWPRPDCLAELSASFASGLEASNLSFAPFYFCTVPRPVQ